ncbi:hypothetical protein MRB53_008015 [Persea americana]|uniref:Uncharacterized protein n=1 Tax=Persea americana TaxID=3435 RepID=A0ACC2MKL0_PERAE|nr:hypothetical protein MRB53_008015 [Persea americana]
MPATLAQYSKIIQNPSHLDLQKAANQGRRCTWEKLAAMKANCGIELVLDECVTFLSHIRRLKRGAERATASQGQPSRSSFSGLNGIPSRNHIALEDSTSLLEELADIAASFPHGSGRVGGSSDRKPHLCREGSDRESETADLSSWTRSGGPLMRTTSADEFIHSLEIDAELNKPWTREEVTHVNVDEKKV